MKRLRSIEAGVDYPFLDVTFFSTYEPLSNLASLLEDDDCVNLHNPTIRIQKAIYEELQVRSDLASGVELSD
jgi:predicted rRNA methylase YqxC with S4 and FtsJ domains